MSKILMVIAPEGYQDYEYGIPRKYLEEKGHEITVLSSQKIAKGSYGGEMEVDILLGDIQTQTNAQTDPTAQNKLSISYYDAVLFVGGGGSLFYANYKPALALAKAFYEAGKLTSAICAAPVILAEAGILNGKKATCFPSNEPHLIQNGATYTATEIEQDGNIITANGPKASENFARAIDQYLASS